MHALDLPGGPKACALLTSPGPGHPAACGAGAGGKHTVDVYSVEARTFACARLGWEIGNGVGPCWGRGEGSANHKQDTLYWHSSVEHDRLYISAGAHECVRYYTSD